jgi:hypothetical protein
MNRWGIPAWLEEEVKNRDKACIYCGIQIINDATIVTRENIARCCSACNSSKGTKKLSNWMKSNYCKKRGINKDTVAEIVKQALKIER